MEHLAIELGDVSNLVDSQEKVGLLRDDVLECLFRSWSARLLNLPKLNEKLKAFITDSIRNGPWSQDQSKTLARLVLTNGQKLDQGRAARRPNQKLMHIENFVPMDVQLKLRDTEKYSQTSRLSILASLGSSLGLELADNPTLFSMIAFFSWCEGDYEKKQDDVFRLMDLLQTFLKGAKRDVEYIEQYPPTAELLPDDIKRKTFGDGPLPPEQTIPELKTMLAMHKMRGRPAASAKKQPEWLKHVPDEYRKDVSATVFGKSTGSQDSPAPAHGRTSLQSSPLPSVEVLRFGTRSTPAGIIEQPPKCSGPALASDVALVPAHEHTDDAVCAKCKGPIGEEDDKATNLDDFENGMLGAYSARKDAIKADNLTKKPAAAIDPEPKAMKVLKPGSTAMKVLKPGSTAMKVIKVIKKPACSATSMATVFEELAKTGNTIPRNNFTSRAYAAALKVKKHAGCSHDECKTYARTQHQKASKLYDTF
jgi:hypothetical protein